MIEPRSEEVYNTAQGVARMCFGRDTSAVATWLMLLREGPFVDPPGVSLASCGLSLPADDLPVYSRGDQSAQASADGVRSVGFRRPLVRRVRLSTLRRA